MDLRERKFEFFRYFTLAETGTVKLSALEAYKNLGFAFGDFDSFKENFSALEKGLQKDLKYTLKVGKKILERFNKDKDLKIVDLQFKKKCEETFDLASLNIKNALEVLDVNYNKDDENFDKVYKKELSSKTLKLVDKVMKMNIEVFNKQ